MVEILELTALPAMTPRQAPLPPETDNQIALLVPDVPNADALLPWLRKIDAARHYTNFGPLEQELAGRIAVLANAPHVATACNATAAITLWLWERIGAVGARVAVPATTFVGTAQAVLASGNIPLILDIDPETWQLSPQAVLEAARTQHIAAVLPVCAFGAVCKLPAWQTFAVETEIPVLIDAAAALGAQTCAPTIDVAYSLHTTKVLPAGEGGAVASYDAALIERLRCRSNFGIGANSESVLPGTNAKLSEYHAAIALATLETWQSRQSRRRAVMRACLDALHDKCGDAVLPAPHLSGSDFTGALPQLPVLLPAGVDLPRVIERMTAAKVQTRRWYYPPLHRHKVFARHPRAEELPIAEALAARLLGLPFHPFLRPQDIDRIAITLAAALANQ